MIYKFWWVLLLVAPMLFAETITVGYTAKSLADYDQKDVKITSEIWLKEIAKDLNMKVVSVIYEDPNDMNEDLKNEKVDYLTGGGLDFIKYFDLDYLDDGFSKGFLNGIPEQYVILVKKNSGIKNITGLKNKLIGIQNNKPIVDMYLDLYFTSKIDMPARIEKFSSKQRIILKLFFGKIDAAIVTNKAFELAQELNPQIAQRVELLLSTKLRATGFGFLRNSLREETKNKLRSLSKSIHETPRGRQLLTLYKTEKIVDSKLKDLQPLQNIYEKLLQLKTRKIK